MKKEPHITEFSAKRGTGLHIRVTTTREGKRIAVDGGRLYYADFSSKKACLLMARQLRDQILREIDQRPRHRSLTVGELYRTSYDLMPVSEATRHGHDNIYNRYISELADRYIDSLKLQDVQMTVNRYAETHEQGRIKRIILLWKRIYKTTMFAGIPVIDLSQMIVPPISKVIKQDKDMSLDADDLDKMITLLSKSRLWKAKVSISLIWVMYYTGMRTTEALALTVDDIDLQRSIIHVRKAVSSSGLKSADIVPLKTKGSRREIPIADGLLPVIEDLLDNADRYLFADPDGEPIPSSVMSMYVCDKAHKHGVHFSLYRLRHMFSADLFRSGINPKVIQSLLGHENDTMSLYYAYADENDRITAIQRRKPS